jgi:hypothetical protein
MFGAGSLKKKPHDSRGYKPRDENLRGIFIVKRYLSGTCQEFKSEKGAPRPGFEPGSKAPEASRMSTTLPRHVFTLLILFPTHIRHCPNLDRKMIELKIHSSSKYDLIDFRSLPVSFYRVMGPSGSNRIEKILTHNLTPLSFLKCIWSFLQDDPLFHGEYCCSFPHPLFQFSLYPGFHRWAF